MSPVTAWVLACALAALASGTASAQSLPIPSLPIPSLSNTGGTGLLRAPTARMAPAGTATAGLTLDGPRGRDLFLGAQVLPDLEVGARRRVVYDRSGWVERLDRGLDLKLRLARESEDLPEIAVGGRDLAGTGARVGFLVLTRRFYGLDLSFGLARRGRTAPFGGVEARTPVPGLTLKLEYAPDPLRAEPGRRPPQPVNAGLAYRPWPWLDLGLGLEQGERVMARVALTPGLADLPLPRPPAGMAVPVGARPDPDLPPPTPARALLAGLREAGLPARAAAVGPDTATVWLDDAAEDEVAARRAGRAARIAAGHAPAGVEELTVVGGRHGLDGPAVSVMRGELERAARGRGSPEEMWRTARITPSPPLFPPAPGQDAAAAPPARPWRLRLTQREEMGLFQDAVALAFRSATDAALEVEPARGLVLGAGARLYLLDNLELLELDRGWTRPTASGPAVRRDVAAYGQRVPLGLEHLYGAWMFAPAPEWSARIAAGQLEEMFGGVGGEVLYRPAERRWAIGVDLNRVWKRPPGEPLALAGPGLGTGHLSLYYDAPAPGLTAALRLGRYLGGDLGGTLELAHRFDNGISLGAFATWTRGGPAEADGRLDQGVRLAVPLGGFRALPPGSALETVTRPLGRDAGQRLDAPLPLYELTTPWSYGRLVETWPRVLE